MYIAVERDQLTGLYNRKWIDAKVKEEIANNKKIGIALFDLDFFTNIEQKIGREQGNEALVGIAELMKQEGFIAGRYGGDEFIFLFVNEKLEDMVNQMEAFKKKFRKSRFIKIFPYEKVRITFSMGISCTSIQSNNWFLLMKSVEIALLSAKKNGRNRIFCSDANSLKVIPDRDGGVCTTVAGFNLKGKSKDNEEAFTASMAEPYGVAITKEGNLAYVDRSNHQIKYISDENVYTLAGSGQSGYSGDGGNPLEASLCKPSGVAISKTGVVYIADTGNHRIRKVEDGIISTIAGNGKNGGDGDGGDARFARLSRPGGVVIDDVGNVYTNDYGNNVIRKINQAGIITTVAGCGEFGYSGDGGNACEASLDRPYGLCVDSKGNNLFIADYGNNCIRHVDLRSGIINTLCGNGTSGYSGDKDNCHNAILNGPFWVYLSQRTLFIADALNHSIRAIDLDSEIITTVVGNGIAGYQDQKIDKTKVMLNIPAGMTLLDNILYIADYGNNSIRKFELV